METSIYRRLAQRLDAIPNGFPATKSGIELRLLQKIFAPEEAGLAAVMRLTPEPSTAIADRAGADPKEAHRTLKQMVRKGLIVIKKKDRHLLFGLMPFIVGIYEEQLPRMDPELAQLFEEYYEETKGDFVSALPPTHRVIPIDRAIPFDLQIFPYEHASQLVAQAKSWGVRDCICRVQQNLLGKGCDRPINNCLILAPGEGVFRAGGETRGISKDEALDILRAAAEAGLVHSTGNYRDNNSYICNCCTCCCGILRSVSESGQPTAIARSDFTVRIDAELCSGCGACVEHCQFSALSLEKDVCVVRNSHCIGCGLCTAACPTGALTMKRRTHGEVSPPPSNIQEWMVERARSRNISMSDIG